MASSATRTETEVSVPANNLFGTLPITPYAHPIIALPFFFFSLESLVALYCFRTHGLSDWLLNTAFAHLLAVNAVHTGLTHFFAPFAPFYHSIIFLPHPALWLRLTGALFLLGGFALAFAPTQVVGAFTLFATFLFFTPCYLHALLSAAPRRAIFNGSVPRAAARLLFQACFLVWAWWFTTPSPPFPF